MSIDLCVSRTKALAVNLVLSASASALRDVLSLVKMPETIAQQLDGGKVGPLSSGFVPMEPSPAIHVKLCDEPETVQIITIKSTAGGLTSYVSMGVERTPLEYALGAAVALALARIQDCTIEDPALFFSSKLQHSPAGFCEAVRVGTLFSDYREAAAVFSRKLRIRGGQLDYLSRTTESRIL